MSWRHVPNPKRPAETVAVYQARGLDLPALLDSAATTLPADAEYRVLWRLEAQKPLSGRKWGVRAYWREAEHVRQERRDRS